jgi:hypothetical protein
MTLMKRLPDDALVVRGGMNLPENFIEGAGVEIGEDGLLSNVSVNSFGGAGLDTLIATDRKMNIAGILHGQIGITTAGKIREAGGDVIPSEARKNPYHATLNGLTPAKASELFRPTIPNPNKKKSRRGRK